MFSAKSHEVHGDSEAWNREKQTHTHIYEHTKTYEHTHTHTHTSTYCPSSSLHDQRKVKQEYRMVVFTDPSRHISSSNLKTLMKEFDLRALFLLNYSLRYAVLLQNHVRVVGRISPYGSSRGFWHFCVQVKECKESINMRRIRNSFTTVCSCL